MSSGTEGASPRSGTAPAPLLVIEDAIVEYHRPGRTPLRAIDGVSLELMPGEILGIVGESGCGKSSLARAMVGLLPLTEGRIELEGRDLPPLTRAARRNCPIQMVFQDPHSSLNPRRTIGAQIDDGLKLRGEGTSNSRRVAVADLLEDVGLSPKDASGYPQQFSGGQLQRIVIARSLAAAPSVLIADEPTSSLDASAQAQVLNLLERLRRERHLSIVLISHDLAVIREVAERVCVMYLGRIVEVASAIDLWTEPLHPYTDALIRSVPEADGLGRMPAVVGGEVPDPAHPPAGCNFRPRCPLAFDACFDDPKLLAFNERRSVACWLHEPPRSSEPS